MSTIENNINNENKIDFIKWEDEFYSAHNDAYRCYLHNQSPICFMNNFLDRIAKITKSMAGYILSLSDVCDNIFPNIEAVFRDKSCEDFSLYNNWKINIDKNSICYKSITTENIYYVNIDDNGDHIMGEPIAFPNNCISYVCIPYKFNDKVIGVLGLFMTKKFDEGMKHYYKIVGNLIASLQNSYFKIKLTAKDNDKRLITFQLLEDILNTVHDGISIVDCEFEIIHTNSYFAQLVLEIDRNIKCSNLLEIFPELILLNDPTTGQKIFKNKKMDLIFENNTTKKNFEFVINTVLCGGGFYHLITIHYKKDENKAFQLNEKKLIAFLSHELRNPLQSITLANHLVKSSIKSSDIKNLLPQKMTSYLEIVNKSCGDMKKIINDILDLSRIESNDFQIEMELCNIEELVDLVIEENIPNASSKNIVLEKNISENTPSTMFTDITRSRQILTNLITNAIKYSNNDVITLKISYLYETNSIKFSVTDQGIGIKENEIHNLFKIYGQTSSSKGNLNSQGLGLCVSQKIANLLGGKITVKSEYLKGSTFSFYHPVRLEMSGNKYENNMSIGELEGSILLVDDNQFNLILLQTLLEQFNYEYTWAIKIEAVNSGDKAIELSKINMYDIIFMDINMPGINGCTTSKIIKSNNFNGKIIATTGNILSKDENKKIDNSENYNYFDEVIIKPFDDQIVLKVLRKFLTNKSNSLT